MQTIKMYVDKNTTLLFALLFVLLINSHYIQIVLAESASDETSSTIADVEITYKYCGNSFSHKFHRHSCPFGEAISKRNLVLFQFRKDAVEAKYAPCKYCLPPIWTTAHGVLLPKAKPCNNFPMNSVIDDHERKDKLDREAPSE